MTAQQVYGKYIKPMRDNPDYTLPEKGSMLFYAKKHPEGYDIDKITFTSLDEDYCVSLIESIMDSKDFAGWPFRINHTQQLKHLYQTSYGNA